MNPFRFRAQRLLLPVALTWLVAGCGSSKEPSDPVEIVSFRLDPDHLLGPASIDVTWEVRGADSIDLFQDGEPVQLEEGSLGPSSSLAVWIEETTRFELIARGQSGKEVREERTVILGNADGRPSIASFHAPQAVSPDELGRASVELRWEGVFGADEVWLEADTLESVQLGEGSLPDGGVEVAIVEDTEFRLVATNANGETVERRTVLLIGLPQIQSFVADRARVGSGEQVRLSWSTVDASAVELRINGTLEEAVEPDRTSGSFELPLYFGTTVELRAYNDAGAEAIESLELQVGAPLIVSFHGSTERHWFSEPLVLSWETVGASSLSVRTVEDDSLICTRSDAGEFDQSSCEWQAEEPGDHLLRLIAANASGVDAAEWRTLLLTGPELLNFFVSETDVAVGEEVVVTWNVGTDPAELPPTVELRDSLGAIYPTPTPQGFVTVTLDQVGAVEFRLGATTEHPLSVETTAAVLVTVHGPPDVSLSASTTYIESEGEELLLEWTSANAASLEIYVVHEGSSELLLEISEEDRASGSHRFLPGDTATYRIVATNGMGLEERAEIVVEVAPPEVLFFEADPLEVVAGQPVLLSWETQMAQELALSIFEGMYVQEETTEPYLDAAAMGGTRLGLFPDCGADIPTLGCRLYQFPGGFRFPFDGEERGAVRVYSNGILSFDLDTTSQMTSLAQRFPTQDPTFAFAHLAPFWEGLAWDRARFPTGNIFTLFREDPAGDSLIIQWKGIGIDSEKGADADLNFEVILWADGSFEYRYGTMEPGGAALAQAEGNTASIGFQLPSGEAYDVRNFHPAPRIRGSLYNRALRYTPTPVLLAEGSFLWHPYTGQDTAQVELQAIRGKTTDAKTLEIRVHQRPEITLTRRGLSALPGAEFRIAWETRFASSVEIVDSDGVVRCSFEDEPPVQEGFCSLQESQVAIHPYRIRATGALGYEVEKIVEVAVHPPFGIGRFEPNAYVIEPGATLRLEWETSNAKAVRLFANGRELDLGDEPPLSGSYEVESFSEDTLFLLQVINEIGAVVEERLSVALWEINLDVRADRSSVRPGERVLIDVEVTANDGDPALPIFSTFDLVEVEGSEARYSDIRDVEGAREVVPLDPTATVFDVVKIDLPEGFSFPFFAERYEHLWVAQYGYLSFAEDQPILFSNNMPFPHDQLHFSGTRSSTIHLAAFWDTLCMTPNCQVNGVAGQIWAALVDPDTFIVQWTRIGPSITQLPDSIELNFQIVMRRDGAFEFRYGEMKHLDHPKTDHRCFPSPGNCEDYVSAASATIGYQHPAGDAGYTLHNGGRQLAATNPRFPGGLEHRTFRYEPAAGQLSLEIFPNESRTYRFCSFSGELPACKSIEIEAEFGIDSFEVSKDHIVFGEPLRLSWASTGGRTLEILDSAGVTIHSTTDPAEIDEGSLELELPHRETFTLKILAGDRVETLSRTVQVERARLSGSIPPRAAPGEEVSFSWEVDLLDPSFEPVVIKPMEEVSDSPFAALDLSEDPAAIELMSEAQESEVLVFEDGFSFDFLGVSHDRIQVGLHGVLNFDPSMQIATLRNTNPVLIPTTNAFRVAHLAPFWGQLNKRESGRVFAKRIDADTYVIQWSQMSLNAGSLASNEYDLNFMVVLHRGGDFEYRYGTMAPPPGGGLPSGCNPNSCYSEANGGLSTIGYQHPSGRAGFLLYQGRGSALSARSPLAGGLEGRSWRYFRDPSITQVRVSQGDSKSYQACLLDPVTEEFFCSEPASVEVEWGIDSFVANPTAPIPGEAVRLSWESFGLDGIVILANGEEILELGQEELSDVGSFEHEPTAKTTYTLRGRSLGRTTERSASIELRTFDLELESPPGRYLPGDMIPFSWNATTYTEGSLELSIPLSEVPAGPGSEAGFLDISGLPGAKEVVFAEELRQSTFPLAMTVDLPFSFPYLDGEHEWITLHTEGYASFSRHTGEEGGAVNPIQNMVIPVLSTSPLHASRVIQLAVFWDSLRMPLNRGKLWTHALDPDTFILQWSRFSAGTGTRPEDLYDLNFQIWLHSNGDFEYRYGTMENCAGCIPYAAAESATIGYQSIDTLRGSLRHFGGVGQEAAFPGGLAHRSFRFNAGATSATVGAAAAEEITICGKLGEFEECKSITLRPYVEVGDLMITELMIDPAGGPEQQWFELRNLKAEAIDLEDFWIETRAGRQSLQVSTPLAAGSFLTVGAPGVSAFTPDVLLEPSIRLSKNSDRLAIGAGNAVLGSVAWGSEWAIPPGESLALEPSFQRKGSSSNDDFKRWCKQGQGSPGAIGGGCLSPYYVVDPAGAFARPFIDISRSGTMLQALVGISYSPPVLLPITGFSLPVFGEAVSTFWVGQAGWVSTSATDPGGLTAFNAPSLLPRAGGVEPAGPIIAAFWDSLGRSTQAGSSVRYERRAVGDEEVLLIQWTRAGTAPGWLTYQVQLWESGEIVVAFQEVSPPNSLNRTRYNGSTAWIGIEGFDPTDFLTASYRQGDLSLEGQSFRFLPK